MTEKIDLKLWWIGVAMLVALIAMGATVMGDSPYAITDHQGAATAQRVDEIQQSWREDGYFGLHIFGMIGDLVFIVVYSLGAWRAGKGLRARPGALTSLIGLFVMGAAVIFFLTDMTETSLQLVQMVNDEGVDWMASTAAIAQPIKFASWIASFLGVLLGLASARFSSGGA